MESIPVRFGPKGLDRSVIPFLKHWSNRIHISNCLMLLPAKSRIPVRPSNRQFFASLLNLCKTLTVIKQLHTQLIINGLLKSVYLGTKLVNSYVEFGSVENAHKLFDQITHRNQYSWNTIIAGFSKKGHFFSTLSLYKQMRSENIPSDSFNLVFVIKACAGLSAVAEGKSFHCKAIETGLDNDVYVAPALIGMYATLGCLEDARRVFDKIYMRNSVAWGSIIKGYLQSRREDEVFKLFLEMKKYGFELDQFSAVGLVQACGVVGAGREGKAFHGYCLRREFLESDVLLQTSIVVMYAKCNFLDNAQNLFEEMHDKDIVLWSAMVAGFAQNGRAFEAISIFRQMLLDSVKPNIVTLTNALQACSFLGAWQEGKSIHGFAIRNDFELDVVIYTAFIDFYVKCASIGIARKLFEKMPERNVFTWSVMIAGYGMHGLCSEAIALFTRMKLEGLMPNSITFISLLSACSHSGMVEEGLHYFTSMSMDYGIIPLEEHYACIVDLLGRAGRIKEAELVIEKMPLEPGASVWGAMMGAYRTHGLVESAEQAAEKLFIFESDRPEAYVLLSNVYAMFGMWNMVKKTRMTMREKKLQKTIGFSSI